jgi:hypothetical protein
VLGRETLRALSLDQEQLTAIFGGQVMTWQETGDDCVCETGRAC